MIEVRSAAFNPGERIPKRHSREGEDISPPLSWGTAPAGTREFALICDDPDAPREDPWVHWVVYKIPPDTAELSEGSAGGGTEGQNDFDEVGYGGPMPPEGHGTHHYHFKIYALDTEVELGPGATKQELLDAIKGHTVEEGEIVGTYER